MSNIITKQTEAAQTIARPIETLAQACVFRGERIASMASMSGEEAIRLSTYLIEKGDTTKANGLYVIAHTVKAITDEKDAKAFLAALKSELVNTAKEKAESALPTNASKIAREGALSLAEEEGKKRFDNLGQAIRAARFILDNPSKVADSVSVFTVAQANAYTVLPALKDDADAATKAAHAEKEKVQAAVLPLLKKGASQSAIKKAITDTKEAIEKAKEAAQPKDNRTPEEIESAKYANECRQLVTRIVNAVAEFERLGGGDVAKIKSLREEVISRNPDGSPDKAQGTLRDRIAVLATLAGLEVKK